MAQHALALRKLAKIAEGSGVMTFHLQADQEDRIAEAARLGVYQSPDEVIGLALEVLHAQDQLLTVNWQPLDAKIRRGIKELDRGEGIPEDELDAHLKRLKAQPG
jgi:hypothetical protein